MYSRLWFCYIENWVSLASQAIYPTSMKLHFYTFPRKSNKLQITKQRSNHKLVTNFTRSVTETKSGTKIYRRKNYNGLFRIWFREIAGIRLGFADERYFRNGSWSSVTVFFSKSETGDFFSRKRNSWAMELQRSVSKIGTLRRPRIEPTTGG